MPPGYVPSFRIRETRDQYEARLAASNAEIEQWKAKVQALTGVTPQTRSEEDTVREQLYKVVPDLKEILEMREQLKQMASQKEDYAQQNQHYWNSYNRTQMDRLFKTASDSYDGQPLSDVQKRSLQASFVGWASSDPVLADRYQSDPTLIDQFWKEFSSSFIDPARRSATATAAGRAASGLPQDTPSGGLRTTGVPPEPKDLDDRVGNAWAAFNQIKQGGGF